MYTYFFGQYIEDFEWVFINNIIFMKQIWVIFILTSLLWDVFHKSHMTWKRSSFLSPSSDNTRFTCFGKTNLNNYLIFPILKFMALRNCSTVTSQSNLTSLANDIRAWSCYTQGRIQRISVDLRKSLLQKISSKIEISSTIF